MYVIFRSKIRHIETSILRFAGVFWEEMIIKLSYKKSTIDKLQKSRQEVTIVILFQVVYGIIYKDLQQKSK